MGLSNEFLRGAQFKDVAEGSASKALSRVLAVAGDLEKGFDSGGYFGLKLFGTGEDEKSLLIEPVLVGKVFPDYEARLVRNCLEKNDRLEVKFVIYGHLSSYQSRDPENHEWGGAIVGQDDKYRYGFSFSGLSEHCDEAITLLVAMDMGFLSNDEAIHIANISQNTVFLRCLTQMEEPTEVGDQVIDNEPFSGR